MTRPRPSGGATGGRTRSARRSVSPSTSSRSRTSRSRSASATRWPRPASRSPNSCPRSRRSSALSGIAIGGIAYLIAYGARTPLLALRGLTRVRNLALVIGPAVAMRALALALQDRVHASVSAGAIAVALVPAPLVAPEIVGRLRGGRMDQAGALVLGTAIA